MKNVLSPISVANIITKELKEPETKSLPVPILGNPKLLKNEFPSEVEARGNSPSVVTNT